MAKRVSKRATRGGERQSTEALGHRIGAPRPERSVRSVWTRRAYFPGACGPSGSSARCDLAPRWPAGSPAQWQTPGKWGCAGTRDRATKPSRGWLRVAYLKAHRKILTLKFPQTGARSKFIFLLLGCPFSELLRQHGRGVLVFFCAPASGVLLLSYVYSTHGASRAISLAIGRLVRVASRRS